MKNEEGYLNLIKDIFENGVDCVDRTGIGTTSVFGKSISFDLTDNKLPMLTSKKLFARGVIEELLFFIRGNTNSKLLEEKNVNIWKGNTSRAFLDSKNLKDYPEGEMGPMYGYQWRNFNGVDQLQNCLNLIKNDPNSRRIMVTAYNPSVSDKCVLDPCHLFFQFYVKNGELSCQWYQRSVDVGLGLPFNILSYAILTHLMAKASGLKAKELIFVGGDTHIYLNHKDALKQQLQRSIYAMPTLEIKKSISSIEDMESLEFSDFEILNYQSHPTIKMDMAV